MRMIGRDRTILSVLAAMLAGVIVTNASFAQHDEPRKAKKYSVELVTAYEKCVSPNDSTPALGIPACSPVVRSDSLCGMDPLAGRGKFGATILSSGDIDLRGKIRGLSEGCEGETLAALVTVRLTMDNCTSGGACTTGDFPMPIGTCKVSNGKCSIHNTVNDILPGALTSGNNQGFEVLGCNFTRSTGPGSPVPTFGCGVLLK